MRKFVAQYSSGLRVRLNPSLQSEQVGIIKPNGIISFIDEVPFNFFKQIELEPERMELERNKSPSIIVKISHIFHMWNNVY